MWGGNGLKWKFSLQTNSRLTCKERQRSHPDHATNPDRHSTSTSNRTQIAPFDFASEPRGQDCTPLTSPVNPKARIARLWLRWLRMPSTLPRWHWDGTDRTEIAIEKLLGFDEFDRIWWIFFGWALFLCLSIEKWYYIFVWKLRKCEEQEENVFSILFSTTQPNTRKYFPKHFLECN